MNIDKSGEPTELTYAESPVLKCPLKRANPALFFLSHILSSSLETYHAQLFASFFSSHLLSCSYRLTSIVFLSAYRSFNYSTSTSQGSFFSKVLPLFATSASSCLTCAVKSLRAVKPSHARLHLVKPHAPTLAPARSRLPARVLVLLVELLLMKKIRVSSLMRHL